MEWQERIAFNPKVCHGLPCIRGTRVIVSVILDNLAAGISVDQILQDYPTITAADIQACIAYAADLAREHVIPLAAGAA